MQWPVKWECFEIKPDHLFIVFFSCWCAFKTAHLFVKKNKIRIWVQNVICCGTRKHSSATKINSDLEFCEILFKFIISHFWEMIILIHSFIFVRNKFTFVNNILHLILHLWEMKSSLRESISGSQSILLEPGNVASQTLKIFLMF